MKLSDIRNAESLARELAELREYKAKIGSPDRAGQPEDNERDGVVRFNERGGLAGILVTGKYGRDDDRMLRAVRRAVHAEIELRIDETNKKLADLGVEV